MAKAKKSARKAAPKAPQSIRSVLTKSQLVAHLADAAKVAAKDVRVLLAALEDSIRASISKKGPRTFVLPGLLKITAVAVPAKKARKGVNPFTGEETDLQGQARDRQGQGAPDEETKGRRERLTQIRALGQGEAAVSPWPNLHFRQQFARDQLLLGRRSRRARTASVRPISLPALNGRRAQATPSRNRGG